MRFIRLNSVSWAFLISIKPVIWHMLLLYVQVELSYLYPLP